jgi:hypothetical protein
MCRGFFLCRHSGAGRNPVAMRHDYRKSVSGFASVAALSPLDSGLRRNDELLDAAMIRNQPNIPGW